MRCPPTPPYHIRLPTYEALMDLAPPERKKAPLGPLGRPYQDVWEEENFLSSLRGDEGDATVSGDNIVCRSW